LFSKPQIRPFSSLVPKSLPSEWYEKIDVTVRLGHIKALAALILCLV
jgi:hypothetical protein